MFRKIALTLAATAVLGTAALTSTVASAHSIGLGGSHIGPIGHGPVLHGPIGHGPHHFGHRWPWIAAGVVGAGIVADSCYRREVIDTPYGPELRWVDICY